MVGNAHPTKTFPHWSVRKIIMNRPSPCPLPRGGRGLLFHGPLFSLKLFPSLVRIGEVGFHLFHPRLGLGRFFALPEEVRGRHLLEQFMLLRFERLYLRRQIAKLPLFL